MNLDYDINEKVSNLECLGRKICSDLRNFQRERIILSREAKCLLLELEREKAQRDNIKNKVILIYDRSNRAILRLSNDIHIS